MDTSKRYSNDDSLPLSVIKEGSPMPFVKIHQTILDSSIWRECHPTRIVWITMLAMANEYGVVEASPIGLADRARVTIEELKMAIAALSSPDEMSKSQDYEGRRIEQVPGGWLILNHTEYRDRRTKQQIQTAERVRRHRENKAKTDTVTAPDGRHYKRNVTPSNASNDLSPSEADRDTEKKKKEYIYLANVRFEELKKAYPKKNGKLIGITKAHDRFMALSESKQVQCVASAANYAKCEKVAGGYVKEFYCWITDHSGGGVHYHWEDWIEPERRQPPKQDLNY